MESLRKAVFLDRDGVLNHDPKGYISRPDDIHLIAGVKEALAKIVENGYLPIVITNQSGIGRGYFTNLQLIEMHMHLNELLDNKIYKFLYCPHLPEEYCECRKPNPRLIIKASNLYNIDLSQSWMIGDKDSDILCGIRAGVKTIGIGKNITLTDCVFPNLLKAVDLICNV